MGKRADHYGEPASLFQKNQTTNKEFKLLGVVAAYFRKLGHFSQLGNKKEKENRRIPSVCHLLRIAVIQLFPSLGWTEMRREHLMLLGLGILEGETDSSGQ